MTKRPFVWVATLTCESGESDRLILCLLEMSTYDPNFCDFHMYKTTSGCRIVTLHITQWVVQAIVIEEEAISIGSQSK